MLISAQELNTVFPTLRVLENEPMREHCSFRIGGSAALFAEPASEAELTALCLHLRAQAIPYIVIGNGTNLLVNDAGIDGVVIHLGERFSALHIEGDCIRAEAGVTLAHLAVAAKDQGLAGLEFAHGIPGSLGGAVMMNAGAYGGEMKDVVVSVRYLNADGEIAETDDPDFAYRHSRFSDGKSVILGATVRLQRDESAAIHARMMELRAKRSASQPLEKPSAGSFFKRPANGYAAAMIDGAGLKGLSVGGAQVSEKHAGFVINTGGASCADVFELIAQIQQRVERQTGHRLECEMKIVN